MTIYLPVIFKGYNTTGLGTGNQYDTSDFPLGAHQRNTNVKDRIVGKVERAFGGNTSGTGADNQYSNGRSGDGYPPGGNQNQGVTGLGTSVDPSVTDKLVGSAKKVAGKVTGNNDLYQEGKARAVSWISPSLRSVRILNICFYSEYQGWRDRKLWGDWGLLSRPTLSEVKSELTFLLSYCMPLDFSPFPFIYYTCTITT